MFTSVIYHFHESFKTHDRSWTRILQRLPDIHIVQLYILCLHLDPIVFKAQHV